MDGIRFILEDPQAAGSRQKKRSRLVTACDTCRAKKIKCHQSATSSKCEACRLSKSACRFRDRERYHAQRSGSLSASSSTFPSDSDDNTSYTDSPDVATRRATLPALSTYPGQAHARSSSLPPALPRLPSVGSDVNQTRVNSPRHDIGPQRSKRSSSRHYGLVAPGSLEHGLTSRHSTPSLVLASTVTPSPLGQFRELSLNDGNKELPLFFDPLRPAYPSQQYLEHGIDLFFDNFASRFPFLNRERVHRSIVDQTLSAPLANSITALALRFSHSTDVVGNSRVQLGDPYLEMAKDLIMPSIYSPTVDSLQALLLLAWGEYGSGREQGLVLHSALAVQMALDLQLGNEDMVQSVPAEAEQLILRQTWWSVVLIDIIASWVSGVPTVLGLQPNTTAVPASSFLHFDSATPPNFPYACLQEMLSTRDSLLQVLNMSYGLGMHVDVRAELQNICSRLRAIQLSLPDHLTLNIGNLRRSFQEQEDTVFIILHLMLSTLIAISHCPSLFRSFPCQLHQISDEVSSAARTIIDIVAMIETLDTRAISAIPFLDFPLAVAARIFAMESHLEQELPVQDPNSALVTKGRIAEVSLGVCNSILTRLAEYWGNVRTMEMTIQSGTVWTFALPIQQSPVALSSALGLDDMGADMYNIHMAVPQLHVDASDDTQELALTYSDSDLSREPSPLIFDFPALLSAPPHSTSFLQMQMLQYEHHGNRPDVDRDQLQRPSSDPTPTTCLPPVSIAAGEMASYDDLSSYMGAYSEPSNSQQGDCFPVASGECLPSSAHSYGTDGSREERIPTAYPTSPWLLSS